MLSLRSRPLAAYFFPVAGKGSCHIDRELPVGTSDIPRPTRLMGLRHHGSQDSEAEVYRAQAPGLGTRQVLLRALHEPPAEVHCGRPSSFLSLPDTHLLTFSS